MKTLGFITQEEAESLHAINRRKAALENLLLTLVKRNTKEDPLQLDGNSIYEKLIEDYGRQCENIEFWWLKVTKKYQWLYKNDDVWNVSYETKEVTLMTAEEYKAQSRK